MKLVKALSSKRIMDAKNIENECLYYRTNVDIMVDVDYNERFPIDNFVIYLQKNFNILQVINLITLFFQCCLQMLLIKTVFLH